MAFPNKDGGSKKPKLPSLNLFTEYGFTPDVINWKQVPDLHIRTAIAMAMQAGMILSFAPAQGGLGVTVRLYADGKADQAFGKSAEQVSQILDLIVRKLESTSEDAYAAWARPGELKKRAIDPELAAD